MRTALVLSLCLVLCGLFSGCGNDKDMHARTEDLAAFSITLPEGWVTNIPDGIECTASRCVAGFTLASTGARAVTVSVVPNLGKPLAVIAEESRSNMQKHEAVMEEVQRSETRVEYKGTIKDSPARLIATFDEASSQVGILLIVGENKQVMGIVDSLRMKNPALDFLRR